MSRRNTFDTTRLLAPWQALGDESATVIATRLAMLPMLWATNPAKAETETRLMFDEKQAAATETVVAMWQAPFRFWMDVAKAGPFVTPDRAASRAFDSASRRLSKPSSSRVKANRKRLAKG